MPEGSNFDDIARILTERIVGAVQDGGSPFTPVAEDRLRRTLPTPPSRSIYRPSPPSSSLSARHRRRGGGGDLMTLAPLFAMAFAVILKVGPGAGVNLIEEFQFALSFVRVLLMVAIIMGIIGIYLKPHIAKVFAPPLSGARLSRVGTMRLSRAAPNDLSAPLQIRAAAPPPPSSPATVTVTSNETSEQ